MESDRGEAIFRDPKLQSSFEMDGYVVISLLNDQEILQLKNAYQKKSFDNSDGFYSTSFSVDNDAKTVLENEIESVVKDKAQQLFYPYQNLGSCYLIKAPGPNGEMPIHQDWTVVDESQYDSLTLWAPLSDVSNQNGALQVIPGSHRFSNIIRGPSLDSPTYDIQEHLKKDLINIPLKAGQAIIFSQALMHASPANQSKKSRIAITYGLIPKNAQLLFYHSEDKQQVGKYEIPIDFFKTYNTQIGSKPSVGKLIETLAPSDNKLSLKAYKEAKKAHNLKKSNMNKMIPIFKSPEHQHFFEKEGYLVLPLLGKKEINHLKNFYEGLQLKDSQGFGFHVSMDDLSQENNIKVRKEIWNTILPKMEGFIENYKPFVASYVVKETNPKSVVPAHQDWSFVDKEEKGYCSITCWTALVDTFLDNGCMGVIRGSHKLMQNHRPSPSPQTPVPLSDHMFSVFPYLKTLEMKAGEVLFFDNRTFHASPPNTCEGVRLAAGIGITQKDAKLVHYHLKPDGNQNIIQKYAIDEDFFIKYNNTRLSKLYDEKRAIEGYELMEEVSYSYDKYSSEELIALIKEGGNEFNVPMCEKLSVLFGYDLMTGKKQKEEVTEIEEDTKEEVRTEIEKDSRAFFEIYTPVNILKEVKYRITGK